MRITPGGDVGIGTNNPTSRLHVKGNDNQENFVLESTQVNSRIEFSSSETISTGNRVTCGAREDDFAINLGSGLNTRFLVQPGGNVGIGTSNPAIKLDVNGKVRAANGLLCGTDTADANALDDYEEGSWTPTITQDGTSPLYSATPSTIVSKYTKIGNQVHARLIINFASNTSINDGGKISVNLPFDNQSGYQSGVGVAVNGTSQNYTLPFNILSSNIRATAFDTPASGATIRAISFNFTYTAVS